MVRAASLANICAVSPRDQFVLHRTCMLAIISDIYSRMCWYECALSYDAAAFAPYATSWELTHLVICAGLGAGKSLHTAACALLEQLGSLIWAVRSAAAP